MTRKGDQRISGQASEALAWKAAQELVSFTTFGLAAHTHLPWERVRRYMPLWYRRGRIEKLGLGRKRRMVYRVMTVPTKAVALPPMTADQAMWNTARRMTQFTALDIHMNSNTSSVSVDRKTVDAFCARLVKIRYARCLRKAIPGRQLAVYFLHRETGPLPPVEKRIRAVWDQNTKKFVHVPEPRE